MMMQRRCIEPRPAGLAAQSRRVPYRGMDASNIGSPKYHGAQVAAHASRGSEASDPIGTFHLQNNVSHPPCAADSFGRGAAEGAGWLRPVCKNYSDGLPRLQIRLTVSPGRSKSVRPAINMRGSARRAALRGAGLGA